MKVSVILAHPDVNSFNHAIAGAVVEILHRNGHEVAFHDLYRERFTPVLPAREIPRDAVLPRMISRHCTEISGADGIIVVHPNWWGQPPAILKGWIDRVLRPRSGLHVRRRGQRRWRADRAVKGRDSAGIQHVEYASKKRTQCLWRPA